MPQINRSTNQYTFAVDPVDLAGWEAISNEEWNSLSASGWSPTEYIAPYRVSKDTIVSRVNDAGKVADLMTVIAGLPPEQQFLWTNYAWFWNNNPTAIAICQQLGLDPAVILAPDPYLT
jgi:hypothetical protein